MTEVLAVNFANLQEDELIKVNGGVAWGVVAVAAVAVVGFAVGVYNGYQEAKRADK